MTEPLYIETSAVLRAVLETGTTPEVEKRIRKADVLLTSRLTLVECARALLRAGQMGRLAEVSVADAERQLDALWSRCEIWELTRGICDEACRISPMRALRTLDALHVATFLAARRRMENLEMLSTDRRLLEAVGQLP